MTWTNAIISPTISSSDLVAAVQDGLTAQGYTPTRAIEIDVARKMQTNKAVISTDGLLVTLYDDDNTSVLHQFDVSADKNTRTPV